MSWITHISRSPADGELRCNIQDLDGTRQALPVHQLPHRTTSRLQWSHFLQVDSVHHKVADVYEYLSAMGWSSLPAHGQTVHKFFTPEHEVWIPSQLLVRSLFGAIAPMAKSVFTPLPVTTFCRPILDSPDNQIALSKRHPFFSQNYLRHQTTRQRLSWLAHSKSARRAWGSVYRNARDGLLDCDMPEGVFEFRFAAVRRSNVLCVTRANLRSVTCSDIFTRKTSEPQSFAFGKGFEHLASEEPEGPSTTVRREPVRRDIKYIEMSDATFESIQALLGERQPRGSRGKSPRDLLNLRVQLNLIQTRNVHGCTWHELRADAQEVAPAKTRYARYLRQNLWGDIQDILLQDASTEST